MSWARALRQRILVRWLALGVASLGVAWLGWGALVAAGLYPTERLSVREASSLVVLDRNQRLLWQAGAPSGERRVWAQLFEIAPVAVQASLAAEDHRFYDHRGVDPWGVLRALWLDARSLSAAYGGSTITMQLVRLLEPELDTRSLRGKLIQALHAARLERALGKREILEQYMNRAYYGNGAFGIGSAAQLYFGTSAANLSPRQAAFLAALPRAPNGYDPYRHKERAEGRMRHILARMRELGWLAEADYRLALDSPSTLRREPRPAHARHFLDHLLVTLPRAERDGARLTTTLDLDLQRELEVATRRHLEHVGSRDISEAGVVILDNRSGDILAMVGSHDYTDVAGDGAVNVTTLPRRAGSTLKPFVYGLALERGASPATLAYDVILPGEARETYTADVRQHGFARYREALAGSYNLAAVHTLQTVGVDALLERLRRAGVSTLRAPNNTYGPDLAIGNAEIELIEYAGAFAAFGNEGRAVRPRAVLRNEPAPGAPRHTSEGTPGARVFSPEVAYQIFDILSDPDARRPMFGRTAPMEVGFPIALKTGTTRGYTDNLAFGTTREYTVGAWAGNFDGTPTEGVMAMQGAAPLVRAAFVALAARYGTPTAPERPADITTRDVCPLSGARPGPYCPGRKRELFTPVSAAAFDRSEPCTYHVHQNGKTKVAFPDELRHWAASFGLEDANRRRAPASAPLSIVYPSSGSTFVLEPGRAAQTQMPPLRALPLSAGVGFSVDGVKAPDFVPTPGRHVVRAERGRDVAEAEIYFE